MTVQAPTANPSQTTANASSADEALALSGRMPITDLMARATVLTQQGLGREAARLYGLWIAHSHSPHHHIACFNWGTLLAAQGEHAAAEAAYKQALAYAPGMLQALLNLGHAQENQGRADEALATWATVIERCAPGNEPRELLLHALNNRARLLEQQRRFDEAEAVMAHSLTVQPEQGPVLQHYVHIRQKQCKWPVHQPVGDVTANQLLLNTSALAMLSHSDDPALQLLAAHKFAKDRIGDVKPVARVPHVPHQKLRIGYLSGDLCLHAVGMLTVELLELHDKARVETYGFCWSKTDGSALQARIRKSLDHHIPLTGLSDEAAAQAIAQREIDVIIDLQGLTNGARPGILARRPAPVQASYLGLPATSGIPGVTHILCDRYVIPEAAQPYYTERPIYLPNCYQSSDRQREVGPLPTRAQYGLPEDAFVYASFNNNHKFTPEVFGCWMRVLCAVPNSVLWLLADNRWCEAEMRAQATAAGVDAARLHFAPRAMPPEYLARMQLIDLFLDTFPFNAGTTANDVLWMGTPLLTRSGRSFISRMAGSLLTAAGMPDLVVETIEDYEAKAILFGREPQRARHCRDYLRAHVRGTRLFDMPTFVRGFEDALIATHAATTQRAGPPQ